MLVKSTKKSTFFYHKYPHGCYNSVYKSSPHGKKREIALKTSIYLHTYTIEELQLY